MRQYLLELVSERLDPLGSSKFLLLFVLRSLQVWHNFPWFVDACSLKKSVSLLAG